VNAVTDGMTQVAAASAGGLSLAEAADRLARYGPNELPRARATPWWRLVADQLRDPLILVLLVAAVLTVATGDLADASVIVLVIVMNTAVGVVQEIKAGQAIAAYLLPGAVLVHDSKHRWRIFPDRVAALGGTSADTAGPVSRQ
jgi:P-type Ca2+ transporter type 2C